MLAEQSIRSPDLANRRHGDDTPPESPLPPQPHSAASRGPWCSRTASTSRPDQLKHAPARCEVGSASPSAPRDTLILVGRLERLPGIHRRFRRSSSNTCFQHARCTLAESVITGRRSKSTRRTRKGGPPGKLPAGRGPADPTEGSVESRSQRRCCYEPITSLGARATTRHATAEMGVTRHTCSPDMPRNQPSLLDTGDEHRPGS